MILSLSLSVRVAVNAEALNMAEAVGNYTRHRKAPVVLKTENGYTVVYVPAVSGESLAHSYQLLLAQIAKERGLPVTRMDELGYFLKFSDDTVVTTFYGGELTRVTGSASVDQWLKSANAAAIEKAFVKASVVADVAGFLYTPKTVKRNSAIRFSYMLPTLDAIEGGGVAVVPQLHTRYSPPELAGAQKLFYIESGTAVYTFSAELVASDISRLYYGELDQDLKKQAPERAKAAVDALIAMVDGMVFGAKRSRYTPVWEVKSLVASLSKGPVEFVTSPGITRDYIKKTYERAVSLTKILNEKGSKETINIFAYNGEGLEEPTVAGQLKDVTFEKASTHTEALEKAREKLAKLLELLFMV
ncbi:CRISPR-associated autoregulator, DevR family [Thermogladius calderae 1633]|uniref:CRISPR-associated autoregulator, DevR family n=1 Tax=Thermogladius calderae (strain DSM 22663 / VKM B-2946 / 1633) TaxID=1184251 RepID=I3TFA3_THEC1|nr:type I-A CRISPR-associated protein Cas7/Csa2 [Thermogladius calderae]AFK51441.1 CRISPR-associated autoregulator, DevR family [Thermogladius calderae 1633]